MNKALGIALIAAALSAPSAITAHAADVEIIQEAPSDGGSDAHGGIKIGYLACDVGEGGGYVLGSAKELDCEFRSSIEGDGIDTYVGTIKKFGVDLGYTARGRLVWAVLAPTAGYHHGSLRGTYLGAAAEATLGAGLGANVLLGGTGGSIQLQPISVTGQLGLNVAAAGTTVTLKAVR
ncbi:MAG: DUF992 domain-containing protein [Alphaproteobacteria bacterium]|nr:MAG: DUF992 domain-containing protein [Alphaproteobacteria bacterium]